MLARHLADDGPEAPIATALATAQTIVTLAVRIEQVIEAASVGAQTVDLSEPDHGQRCLLVSWLSGLPCQTELSVNGATITASLLLSAPSTRPRPDRVALSPALKAQLSVLAAKTYVPDSAASRSGGAGAAQMDLD
jgi:hypothetical protein